MTAPATDRQRWFQARLDRFRTEAAARAGEDIGGVRTLFEAAADEWNAGFAEGVHWLTGRVAGASGEIGYLLVRPAAMKLPLPALVAVHGGAFVIGSGWAIRGTAAALARRSGHAVVAIDPALAPAHGLADQVADVVAAVRAIGASADALGLDPDRLSLFGESAGACLAVCAAATLGAEGPLRSLLLTCGVFAPDLPGDARGALAGETTEADLASIARMWDAVLQAPADHALVPAGLPAGMLARLPPTRLDLAGLDLFRADSLVLARRLAEAGVPFLLRNHAGAVHGFTALGDTCPQSADAIAGMAEFLARETRHADQNR